MKRKIVLLMFSLFILGFFPMPVKALGNVRIVSSSSFFDSLNALWVVGEVENIGDLATQYTKVTATFYNSSNAVVTTDYGYISLDVLLAGRKSPFSILLLESEGSLQVHNYTLSVSWGNYAAGIPLGLEILSNSSYTDGSGHFHANGTIKNIGVIPANFTEVTVTFYDATGVVVGENSDFTEPLHLAPNQTATFDTELIYTQQVMKVASYSLTAESMQYGIIPELPSYAVISLFMMLTLLIALAYEARKIKK